MATADKQKQALQTIFSFFLGLMVLALIGIAVYTVYPNPQQQTQTKTDKLYRELSAYDTKTPSELSAEDKAKREAIQKQIDDLQKEQQLTQEAWARNTSIALIILATAVMSISLVRSEQLRVLSNGLLLGGVFTMLYGVGWSLASGESWTRLIVIFFATGVTIALGYVKFVRQKGAAVELAGDEAKLAAVGSALSGPPRPPSD
jgi:Flp pilus assembly protein TadB